MKKQLTILFLFAAINVTAQKWVRPVSIIAYHTGTIALGAIADAQHDMGNKEWSHALHAAEVGALIGGPFVFKVKKSEALSYLLTYGFLRFSFFDSFYNWQRDLPVLYNGTTSYYDQTMSKMPDHGKVFYKTWSLTLGIAIPLIELK